ncbi:MAG TPA: HEAT repeat domain-containing protein [Conexibacter sp.]|jgi:HEAT repeat protein|nr:HEAT repeat domain-containing protein [Conexibacter sp.]
MTTITGLMLLVGASLLLWLALASLAVGRKLRRDSRELRSAERRARYSAALRDPRPRTLLAICRDAHDAEAQVDLAVSIDSVYPTLTRLRRSEIHRAIEASELLPELVADLRSRDPVTRARAALLLSRPGIPSVADHLVPLLADPDADVRLVACAGLARIATPRAAEVLIWGLVTRALPPERIIERLGAPWAVETILHTLRFGPAPGPDELAGVQPSGREVTLDASLARALGVARDPRGDVALAGLLRTSPEEEVRISAARALGRVGDAACMPALVAALDPGETWSVRAQAAKSLGALGAAEALEPLEACLSDRAWWVRANAARALRELGEPGLAALRRAVDHQDRYAADRAREQLALHAVAVERAAA